MNSLVILIVFALGALSDYWDGIFSRKYKVESEFGKFYDSLVDKIFVLGIFFFLSEIKAFQILIFLIFIILFRDVLITALRIVFIKKKLSMSTDKHGKIKTAIQIVVQVLLILLYTFYSYLYDSYLVNTVDDSISAIPFSTFSSILSQELAWNSLLINSIEIFPNLLISITAIITIYSGLLYTFKNYKILSNEK